MKRVSALLRTGSCGWLLVRNVVSGTMECATACGNNRIQLCHFNGVEFQTLCIRQSSVLRKAQHTSAQDYCGPCTTHKPFESREELKEAVKQYVDQSHLDVELATAYGWPMNQWNVSLITDFSEVFANSPINEDLSDWDVSQATNMDMMFWHATQLQDGGLWKWNVRQVTSMERMFLGASNFNGDLRDWDTRSVTSMMGMFWKASLFNQDLSLWDTHQLVDASRMFAEASAFNQDLTPWNTDNLQDLSYMFLQATSFAQDLAPWGLPRAITLERMFYKVPYYEQSPAAQTALLTSWRRLWAQHGRQLDTVNIAQLFSYSTHPPIEEQSVVATAYVRGAGGLRTSTPHILHLKSPATAIAEQSWHADPNTTPQQPLHDDNENENENEEETLHTNKTVDCINGVCSTSSILI